MEEIKKPYIGADAIILNEKNQVLLIHRTGKNFNGYWGLVSGMIEWGEDVHTALKREALEEIGVEIDIIRFTGKYYDRIGRHPSKTVICLPHICKITKGIPRPVSECDAIQWFNPIDIKDMELAYDHKQMLKDEDIIE
jgi:ADP-ribose pyrophosphatase YjhB (NUDIX family)